MASSDADKIAWYENNGSQSFIEHTLNSTTFGVTLDVYTVQAADMDRDGDLDLLSGATEGYVAWWVNNGAQEFTQQRIVVGARKTMAVQPADMDGDGDLDVVIAVDDNFYDYAAWYENNGSQQFTIRHSIDEELTNPESLQVVDINGDGDLDVLITMPFAGGPTLFENDGQHSFTESALFSTINTIAAHHFDVALAADLTVDGALDVVSASSLSETIAWYEAYPSGISLTSTSAQILEDSVASSTVTFTRAGDLSAEETFNFAVHGSAAFGIDYTVTGATSFSATTGSITFLAGESTASLTITPIADDDFEGDETVIIRIADYADIDLPAQPENPTDAVVSILHDEPADFGDAADTYLTTAMNNGASHGVTGPRLGGTRDSEADGQPSELADSHADDDGVTFGLLRAGQQNAVVIVNVQNAPSGAQLDAWFDFDGDGNFFGPDEQVATSVLIAEGDNAVPIDIPATARSGETTARFRLSTAGGLTYVGYAVDGEVEDYRVTISPPAAADGVFGSRQPISTTAVGAIDVVTADLDGDGDNDVISAAQDSIDWHESIGGGQFVAHNIAITAARPSDMTVVDLDCDGDLDLLVAFRYLSATTDDVVWFENDGGQTFARRSISPRLIGATKAHAADMDNDGDLDVVVFTDFQVTMFENYGNESFSPPVPIYRTGTSFRLPSATSTRTVPSISSPPRITFRRTSRCSSMTAPANLFSQSCQLTGASHIPCQLPTWTTMAMATSYLPQSSMSRGLKTMASADSRQTGITSIPR